ncbi:MAG: hypothetical protein EA415_09865 [Sphaerobacteraceae bacterium]|nr:MAG: hypothetical protein EA415_09865 [Sphaerobacteraceae bacterium]
MNLEAMMSLEGLITISLVIAATGTALTHIFRNASSPYLVTLTGSRLSLLGYGMVMTTIAVGLGIGTMVLISAITSPMVGLALFFGVQAVALDICFHRTRYVRVSSASLEYSRVRVTLPFNS